MKKKRKTSNAYDGRSLLVLLGVDDAIGEDVIASDGDDDDTSTPCMLLSSPHLRLPVCV